MSIINFPGTFEPKATEKGRICFVLCKSIAANSSSIFLAIENEFGKETEVSEDEDGVYFVSLPNCEQAFFSVMDVPVPDREAQENAENNIYWPDAKKELQSYSSHIIVGIVSGPDDDIELNIQLSRMARVALKVFDGIGVYWGAGAITHSREIFMMMTDDMMHDPYPLYAWIRFQFIKENDENISLYTVGLNQFGLNEIEVKPCQWQPDDLLELVYNISRYLVESGPVINDGDTVGEDESERIIVRHTKGSYLTNERVYRIMMETL